MPGNVCVDASLAIKWIFPEDLSDLADRLQLFWLHEDVSVVAPQLFAAEVTSVIRERTFRREVSIAEADALLGRTLLWPVSLLDSPDLQRVALSLAHRFNRPKAYDAQYLALAQIAGCELWTGDQRLVNSFQGALTWVRWVGEFQGP